MGEAAAAPETRSEYRIASLEAALATERTALAASQELVAKLMLERDRLRASHERLRLELDLLRRRIFVAKAERIDAAQLELEFAQKLAELDHLAGITGPGPTKDEAAAAGNAGDDGKAKPQGGQSKLTGRRDLRKASLEEERVEITDPLFEQLVAESASGTRRAARSHGSAAASVASSSLA